MYLSSQDASRCPQRTWPSTSTWLTQTLVQFLSFDMVLHNQSSVSRPVLMVPTNNISTLVGKSHCSIIVAIRYIDSGLPWQYSVCSFELPDRKCGLGRVPNFFDHTLNRRSCWAFVSDFGCHGGPHSRPLPHDESLL